MRAMEVRFYYDIVCPYAYLASRRVEAVAARAGASVRFVPVLLGGLFRHTGGTQRPADAMSAPKARLNLLDMQRQADVHDVPLRVPAAHPRRTVDAMRLLVAAGGARVPLTHELYRLYWVEGADVTDRAVLAAAARRHGVDPGVIDSPEARQGLFDTTAEAAARGAFGVPSFAVGDTLWWGQDRLHFVEEALGHAGPRKLRGQAAPGARLRFFHDFSSPWSYLASTQVEALAAGYGVEVEWTPILLGGLFREIGTPDVPLLAMTEARRHYVTRDLTDWARWWGVDFRFPSHFPLRTVLPLRVAIVEPATTGPLYEAAWAADRPIDDPAVLADVLRRHGFDAEDLMSRAEAAETKARLRENTDAARAAGACGVPTFEVRIGTAPPMLFWGQDRLDLVGRALEGWRPACG